ncbi:helix-turn-helix transcriptional regulator [Kibdelosporangium aridum]|uniref:HTH domain-containing protein n=1 Tax=Kibdelosporangium aridum TaxID=2030 RepID=A0A1W2FKA3_KIBAR|nr:YafY family protein [Kibdelosporangium aridum]SMD22407.1 HTH domain-containing protein [Kibdelosporangium aridum]
MNRTDRLYAIVEELRAVAPRRRSARELAARYEVSVRTIARDIDALTQAGVPIYADAGRRGGYTVDREMTLPPLNFTPAEVIAAAVVFDRADGTPFAQAARSAIHKIVAAMSARDAMAARDLANRVQLLDRPEDTPQPVPSVIQDAIVDRRVLRLTYLDRDGTRTEREVEPVLFATVRGRYWYVVAWCRLRLAARAFRVDRIIHAQATGEPAPTHPYENFTFRTCDLIDRAPVLS